MKIHLEFDSEEERKEYLGFIAYTMKERSEDLNVVESTFLEQLSFVCKQAYGVGASNQAAKFFDKKVE